MATPMSLYTNLFKQTWLNIWRHKNWWWLGILAVLFGGSIETELFNNFLVRGQNNFYSFGQILKDGFFNPRILTNLQELLRNDAGSFITVIITFLIFLLILLAIIIVAVGAQMIIIDQGAQAQQGQSLSSLKTGLKKQTPRLLPVITLNLLIKVAVMACFSIIALPIMLTVYHPSWWSNALYVILFILLIPLAIIIAFVIRYIIAYVVVYGQSLFQAIRNGWYLFKDHWLISIEMALALFLFNVLGSLVVLILIYAVSIPFNFLSFLAAALISPIFFVYTWWLAYVVFLLMFAVGGGLIVSFTLTAWTNLFLQLNSEGGSSKIARTVGKINFKK